jgi:ABC-type lipoprotein release transport system permease subunit
MANLPLANLLHHKLRSVLSALGIGIGICMLVTLSGLSRGSLFEIAERAESVNADLIVSPRGWGENTADKAGSALPDKYAKLILDRHGDIVAWAAPVFVWPMRLAGQEHRAAGVDPNNLTMLTGGRKLSEGRCFDPNGQFAAWIERMLLAPSPAPAAGDAGAGPDGGNDLADEQVLNLTQADLADPNHDGLELVIDSRLAKAGRYRVGQTVNAAGHDWKIVGIVPAGAMTRVFLPLRTAQFLFGSGDVTKSTMILVKLKPGVDLGPAARAIQKTVGHDVTPLARYRAMLVEKFGIIFTYVDIVNAVALVIAFLFIMITLYTMVLQRTREIAILKSFGASDAFILRQVLVESLMLTGFGTLVGIAMSFIAAWLIQAIRPLLTVTITWQWIAIALAAAAAGAVASGLYPAWRAIRVDVIEALTME